MGRRSFKAYEWDEVNRLENCLAQKQVLRVLEDRTIAGGGSGTGQIGNESQEGAVLCSVFAQSLGCVKVRNSIMGNSCHRSQFL